MGQPAKFSKGAATGKPARFSSGTARSPMYGGGGITPAGLAALAKANPKSTPLGDALGTVGGSVMDYVSRPLYMVGDAIGGDFTSLGKNALNLMLPGTQSIERIAGTRETASQELEKRGVNFGGGVLGFAGRLGTDVVLDPLTYLTFGTGAGLKGGMAISKAAKEAAMRSGTYSAEQIAKLQKHGFLNEAAAMAERTRTATQTNAQREIVTREWNAARGGPTVVAGIRVPTTAIRAINKVAGTSLKPVIPVVESRKAAAALEKVGLGLNAAKGAPTLRAIFSPAGGEDASAYQAMLGAMNATNQHKAMFAREGRQIEHAIEKTGKASGVKKVDASPTVSHLADAVEVGRIGAAKLAKVQERVAAGRATADDLAALANEPTNTKAAYEWLAQNNNHGARFQFPAYEDAVRVFGNPDAPDAGTIMDIVQQQSKKMADYADAAGVIYNKIDDPYYLTHLPANKQASEALRELAKTEATKKGDIRKMQEGFTRHRALPTLRDWYEAEAKLGVKLVPELSVGRRLTVRGVSGASEAMHAVLMRELIKLYGARGPLPDMDELADAVRNAIEETATQQTKLDTLLNRAHSPMATAARSEYTRLRQERIAASKVLKETRAKVSKRAKSDKKIVVDQHELVIAAQKRLDDIQAQIDEIQSRPRAQVAPVDMSAKRQEAIAEATRNLEIAQQDRSRAIGDVAGRVMGAANEKIRQIKEEYSKADDGEAGAFATTEIEQKAIQHETLNQARQELERLQAIVGPVAFAIADVILKSGLGNIRKYAKRTDGAAPPPEESVLFLNTTADEREAMRRRKTNAKENSTSGKNRPRRKVSKSIEGFIPMALRAMVDKSFEPSTFIGQVARTKTGYVPVSTGKITQEMWDDAHEAVNDLIAAQTIVDDLDFETHTGSMARFDERKAEMEATLDALGPESGDRDPFLKVEIPPAPEKDPLAGANVPEGENIPVGAQPSDVIPQTPIENLPWGQRQVIKLIRSRKSGKSWTSVKTKNGRGFIQVGGKTLGVSQQDLIKLADEGWIIAERVKSGEIKRIKPGPELIAEGQPYSKAEDAILNDVTAALDDVGMPEVNRAEEALARASEPVSSEQKRIAQLEAELAAAKENTKIEKIIERELGNVKARRKAAKEQLVAAEKTAREEVIAPAKKAYEDAQAAEQAAKDYADALRVPPNARKVAAATRQRDKASRKSQALINEQENASLVQDAAKAWIASLYKADASYDEAVQATGLIRDGEDWERVRSSWVKISDRYVPKGSKQYDPNGAILFDPAVAPQIQRIVDRINPAVQSQHALRKVGRFVQGITRAWKSLVLATPGYHLRNMIDDGLRAYWAGARNPATFYQAVRILQGKAVKMNIGGKTYTADEILSMANVHGIIGTGSQYHSEVGPAYDRQTPRKWLGGVPLPRKIGSGSIVTNSQAIGEWRENMTRLGTFLELMKNGEHEVIAAKNTRDFLFDYNDTSQFINAAKDFWSPFLTYSLKAIPFYAKAVVQRPGQVANLASFMRDMTATAAYDYPGQIDPSLMPPGQELAFALPHIPGVSDWLFGEGKTGTIDPSNLIGISSINQASPITFPQPTNGESAVGAALGTIPKGAARVFGGFGNPLAVTGIEVATGQDLRYGSPRPDRVRMTPVPLAAQRILSTVSGGNLNMPGYGMKQDQYTGQQVEGMSGNVMRLLNLFPPIQQVGSYTTAASGFTEPLTGFSNPFVTESDRGRIGFARTLFGLPIRPIDISREQFYASRRQ